MKSDTAVPHPPSSSTQQSTTQNTATTEESDNTAHSSEHTETEQLQAGEERSDGPKKNRGLLHVPSRSSSHKIQPSPTSTGLSGVTASDPRGSIGGRSKESKGSFLGRRRNGSTSSSKMSITPPEPVAGASANPAVSAPGTGRQPRKKKGIFSMLCCGFPDHANNSDPNETPVPANKVTKLAPGRPTTASKPDPKMGQRNEPMSQVQNEKEALEQEHQQIGSEGAQSEALSPPSARNSRSAVPSGSGANGDVNSPSNDLRDQPLPDLPKEDSQPKPAVVVEAPTPAEQEGKIVVPELGQKDDDGDVRMSGSEQGTDKDPVPLPVPRKDDEEDNSQPALPPPPPPPVPQVGSSESTEELVSPEPADQKQQWLLPPIAPRFKGKKCLVLDLDETLVHSSFKVIYPQINLNPTELMVNH